MIHYECDISVCDCFDANGLLYLLVQAPTLVKRWPRLSAAYSSMLRLGILDKMGKITFPCNFDTYLDLLSLTSRQKKNCIKSGCVTFYGEK